MANFDIMTNDGRKLFLTYDQEEMIRHYDLFSDKDWLYFWYLCRIYRIGRKDGYVYERTGHCDLETYQEGGWRSLNTSEGGEAVPASEVPAGGEEAPASEVPAGGESAPREENDTWHSASNGLAMTFYDILCYGKKDAHSTGDFINLNSLVTMISAAGNPGKGMFQAYEEPFDERSEALEEALIRLGGHQEGKGDIAYEFPLFPFMNIRFQLWHEDEDFPPQIETYVDTGILSFMHFETVWYMMTDFMQRLKEEIGL